MFEAVILAGGEKSDPLALQEGALNKSFISVQGHPLVGYVLSALAACPSIGKIIVVGPEEGLVGLQGRGHKFTPVAEKGSMLDNIEAGLKAADPDTLCLLSTGDIPLVNPEILENILALCAPYTADFYYPVISGKSCTQRFPHTKRTCVRLKEGTFTGGNLTLIRPSWFHDNRNRLNTFIAYRKHPLKLFKIFPPWFIIKFLFHRLAIKDLETHLSRVLDFTARAVPCSFVELATDVDKPSDLEAVNRELAGKSGL